MHLEGKLQLPPEILLTERKIDRAKVASKRYLRFMMKNHVLTIAKSVRPEDAILLQSTRDAYQEKTKTDEQLHDALLLGFHRQKAGILSPEEIDLLSAYAEQKEIADE